MKQGKTTLHQDGQLDGNNEFVPHVEVGEDDQRVWVTIGPVAIYLTVISLRRGR